MISGLLTDASTHFPITLLSQSLYHSYTLQLLMLIRLRMNTDEICEIDCGWMGLTSLNKVELRAI